LILSLDVYWKAQLDKQRSTAELQVKLNREEKSDLTEIMQILPRQTSYEKKSARIQWLHFPRVVLPFYIDK